MIPKKRSLYPMTLALMVFCILSVSAPAAGDEIPSQERIEEMVAVIRRAYEEANELLNELPKDRLDPRALLEATDYDPEAIMPWVRTHTR